MFFWSFRYLAVWGRGCLQISWAKACLLQNRTDPPVRYSLTMAQLTKAGQSHTERALDCWKMKQWQLCPHFCEWQPWEMLLQWWRQHPARQSWALHRLPGAGLSSIRFKVLLPAWKSPPQLLKGWTHSPALPTGYFCVYWVHPSAFFSSGGATSDQTSMGVLRIMSVLWEVWRNGTWSKGWAFGCRMPSIQESISCNDLLREFSVEAHQHQEPKTEVPEAFSFLHNRLRSTQKRELELYLQLIKKIQRGVNTWYRYRMKCIRHVSN